MFTINWDKKTLKSKFFAKPRKLKDVQKRTNAFVAEFVRQMADSVLQKVLAEIPDTPEYRDYKKSLELVKVDAGRAVGPVYGVRGRGQQRKANRVDTARSILVVRPKKTIKGKRGKAVRLLKKYGPWTAATIPFTPTPQEAKVIVKKVTPGEVNRIASRNARQRVRWKRRFAKLNIKVNSKQSLPREARVVNDLIADALRLEFGLGGTRPSPHWRPALRDVLLSSKEFIRSENLAKVMFDPKFKQWKKWPRRVSARASQAEARTWKGFQDRLGTIKVKGH